MAYGNPNSKESNQDVNNSDNSDVTGFGGPDDSLSQIQDDGEPSSPTRFRDAQSANGWAVDKFSADMWGQYDRSAVDDLTDGAPPMDGADLRLNGQGTDFNINFQRAFAKEETALAAYNNLANGDDLLINCECDYPKASAQERDEYAQIYARGFTRLHRFFWPDFVPNLQLLAKFFIRHGVSLSFRRDPFDWRWSVGRLGDFQISRRDGCSVDDLECAVQRVYETPPDVMNWISNPEAAKKAQWDVEAVKKAVKKATITVGQDASNYNWEQVQRDAKDNGIYMTKGKDPRVELRHFWAKEFPEDGENSKVSHYITSPSNNEKFLCKRVGIWDSPGDCMTFFTYGIGNGDFYSIRGLGYKIFAMEQMFNTIMSRWGTSVVKGSSYLWQASSSDSLEDSNNIVWGSDALVPVGLKPVQTFTQDVGQMGLPFLNMLGNIEAQNTGTYIASQQLLPGGQPDRKSATQSTIEAQQEAVLTSSAQALFMQSMDRNYSMTVRALNKRVYPREMPGGPERWRLLRYCLDHGMPEEAFYNIECVRAVRPIGMGSPIAQQQKLEQVMALLPFLDQQAQQWLVRKKITSNLGIDYGFLVNEKPVESPDKKIAELETSLFVNGITPDLGADENDEVHIQEHAAWFAATFQKVDQQQMDGKDAAKQLIAAGPHIQAHAERLAKNPIKKQESTKANQLVQQLQAATQKLSQNVAQAEQAETEAQQKEQEKMTAFQMEQQRLDAESQARIAREDAIAQADLALKTKKTDSDIQLAEDKTSAAIEQGNAKTEHDIIGKKAKVATDIRATEVLTGQDIAVTDRKTKQKLASDDIKLAQELSQSASKAKKTDTPS